MQAIQGFQVEFPTQIVERDSLTRERRPATARACISILGNGGAGAAKRQRTIEMEDMGMSKVVSMPVNCGYYSDDCVGRAARSVWSAKGLQDKPEAIRKRITRIL